MNNADYILELLEEANISIACMMDEINDITMEDLEHIQDQLDEFIIKLDELLQDMSLELLITIPRGTP